MAGEQHVRLARSIFDAWESGDFSSTDWADPEIEWVTVDGPAPGRWTGVVGMAEASRDWIDTWEHYHVKAREYRELDSERVLVLFDYGGRGKTSGIDLGALGSSGAGVFHIRDHKVRRIVAWWEQERALTDLGLAPPNEGT
jgi:ketosteroid isomerase-like protein